MQLATCLTVNRMSRRDVDLAIAWAASEGWNPGLADAEPFFTADPKGFFLADYAGQPAGSVSAVAYDDHFGFMGLFVVRPEYRGGRCGVLLARTALEYLGSRVVGLDGVLAKQDNYRKHGFVFAYRTIRYSGVSQRSDECRAELNGPLVDLRSVPLKDLAAYDNQLFPALRPRFLEAWIRQPGVSALGAMRGDRLAGYGVIRPCRIGYKIGPLFADKADLAHLLLDSLMATVPDATVAIDIPGANETAVAWAQRQGMTPVFETARMYRGPAPKINLDRVFGVTTLELG